MEWGLRFNNSTFLHGLAGSEAMPKMCAVQRMRSGYAAHAKSCAVRSDKRTPLEFWHGSCSQHVSVRPDELSLFVLFYLVCFCH
jgi:hypothetical protein